jgi:dGTPase
MTCLIDDVLAESRRRLADADPQSAAAVRLLACGIIGLSAEMSEKLAELKDFLFAHMYRHPRVTESMDVAKRIVTELFGALIDNPRLLPPDWNAAISRANDSNAARLVSDYIAGMTDRFAILEHQRIFGGDVDLRFSQP